MNEFNKSKKQSLTSTVLRFGISHMERRPTQPSTNVEVNGERKNTFSSRITSNDLEMATRNANGQYSAEELNEWKLMFLEFDKGFV
jgi:hypothetical protein